MNVSTEGRRITSDGNGPGQALQIWQYCFQSRTVRVHSQKTYDQPGTGILGMDLDSFCKLGRSFLTGNEPASTSNSATVSVTALYVTAFWAS